MKKIILLVLFLSLAIIPLINADTLDPGYKSIPVINNIVNFNDFPDYYFLTVCNPPMPRASLIEDGKIDYCYKFSSLSVYAVKKSEFNVSEMDKIKTLNYTNFEPYFNSTRFIEVLQNVPHYKTVPIASSIESETNNFTINLNGTSNNPPVINKEIQRNGLIYLYTGIPILALIIIVIVLLRKRK